MYKPWDGSPVPGQLHTPGYTITTTQAKLQLWEVPGRSHVSVHGQRDSLGVLLKPNLSRLKIMTVRIPHITSSSHTHTLWEEELGFLALLFQGNPPQVYLLMHKRLIFIYCAYWYICAYLNYFIFIYLLALFFSKYIALMEFFHILCFLFKVTHTIFFVLTAFPKYVKIYKCAQFFIFHKA